MQKIVHFILIKKPYRHQYLTSIFKCTYNIHNCKCN